jgi:hypothetical protein
MEACRCSIVPTICHLTPRLLATVLGPLKKARDHYPSRPYRPRALAPRWQSGKWHSGFIARMTFHLLKDDWGGRRQLTRQIEKIFRCRTSTPPLPPGAGTHRSICSKDDGGGVNASTSRISTSWRRSRGRTRSKSRKDIAAGPIPPPLSSRSNGTPAKGRWDRVNDGDTGRENSHSRSHPTTARHSDPKHRRTRPL